MTTIEPSLPTISADIDSKSNRELNPKNLKLDLQISMNSSVQFPTPPRKSSSSGGENSHETQPHRQRRRRNLNPTNTKINSPSSRSHTTEIDHHSQTGDVNKHSRNVTFQVSPSIINDQRKTFKHANYTSSEEGEVEETHSDSYIFDDEKHRAKHDQSYGNFSSESEIYGEKNLRLSSKNDG